MLDDLMNIPLLIDLACATDKSIPRGVCQYGQLAFETAIKYKVNPFLAVGVMWQESEGIPDARSSADAVGLFQLMPATASGLGVSHAQRLNPHRNVDAGIRYLQQQIEAFGNIKLGLAAYNAGPGNVRKYKGVPPFKETQRYVILCREKGVIFAYAMINGLRRYMTNGS